MYEVRAQLPIPPIEELTAITDAIMHLDRIINVCKTVEDSAPPVIFVREVNLASHIRNYAQDKRFTLNTSYSRIISRDQPYSSEQEVTKIKTFIDNIILEDYRRSILPQFVTVTTDILNKQNTNERNALQDISEEKRTKGINKQTPAEIRSAIAEAQADVMSAKGTLEKAGAGLNIITFVKEAEINLNKIMKAANVILNIFTMSPSSSKTSNKDSSAGNPKSLVGEQRYDGIDNLVSEVYKVISWMQLLRSVVIVIDKQLSPLSKLKADGIDESKVDDVITIPLGIAINYKDKLKKECSNLESEIRRLQLAEDKNIHGLTDALAEKIGTLTVELDGIETLRDNMNSMDRHFLDLWEYLIPGIISQGGK
jgi:hypothetical protein